VIDELGQEVDFIRLKSQRRRIGDLQLPANLLGGSTVIGLMYVVLVNVVGIVNDV